MSAYLGLADIDSLTADFPSSARLQKRELLGKRLRPNTFQGRYRSRRAELLTRGSFRAKSNEGSGAARPKALNHMKAFLFTDQFIIGATPTRSAAP